MNKFKKFDLKVLNKYPDPHQYRKVWERSLWTLHVVQEELGIERLNITEIAHFLTNIIEINTSTQAVSYAMQSLERGFVNKHNGFFKLMKKGRNAIYATDSSKKDIISLYIESNKPFSGKNILTKEVIEMLTGDILICDPYVGPRLLDILANTKKCKIKILTSTIEDKPAGIFARALNDFRKEGYDIEVRIFIKGEIHDRYIIDDNAMWLVGHSIKDIGKKESFIIKAGRDLMELTKQAFNRRWNISNPIT